MDEDGNLIVGRIYGIFTTRGKQAGASGIVEMSTVRRVVLSTRGRGGQCPVYYFLLVSNDHYRSSRHCLFYPSTPKPDHREKKAGGKKTVKKPTDHQVPASGDESTPLSRVTTIQSQELPHSGSDPNLSPLSGQEESEPKKTGADVPVGESQPREQGLYSSPGGKNLGDSWHVVPTGTPEEEISGAAQESEENS